MPNKPVRSSSQLLQDSDLEETDTDNSIDKHLDVSNSNSNSMSHSYRADIEKVNLEIKKLNEEIEYEKQFQYEYARKTNDKIRATENRIKEIEEIDAFMWDNVKEMERLRHLDLLNSKYSSNVPNINTQVNTDAELVLPLHDDVKEFKKDDFLIHDTNHTEVNRVDLCLLPSEAPPQYSQLPPYNNIENTE